VIKVNSTTRVSSPKNGVYGIHTLMLLCSLFISVCHADIDNTGMIQTNQEDYILKTRNTGGVIQISGEGNNTEDRKGTIKDNLLDSVIYTDVLRKTTNKKPYLQGSELAHAKPFGADMATPATDLANEAGKLEQERLARLAAESDKAKETPSYFGGGYCRMRTPVNISKSSEFSVLSCLINLGQNQYRRAEVFAGVYPDYEREILIALPIYATFESGARVHVSGVVLNENKSSFDIADYVDNRRIRQLVGEAGLATNDIAYRYASAYMSALQESKIKEDIEYVSTVDPNTGLTIPVPVATRNVEPPKTADYFAAAGVELVSKLFSIGTKEYMVSADPLFKAYGGKRVWIEGIFEADNKGISEEFGRINSKQIQNVDNNNRDWIRRRDSIINQYNNQTGIHLDNTLRQKR